MRVLLIACIGLLLIGCRLDEESTSGTEHHTMHIVATTGIIEDCLDHIVGDNMEVSAIMGPGTDPHIYKPTPGDIEMLDEADIIVANGLHLEGKMAEMLEKYSEEKPVLWVADGINKKQIIKSADFSDANDPHIWFDTEIWMDGFRYISEELGKIDTAGKDDYRRNFRAYSDEILELDMWVHEQLDSIGVPTLITSHDAFSYFGRKYGMEVKGIQGISTLSEVGLKEISDMVDYIIDNRIKAIFIETSTSDKTAQSIVDGCADKGYKVEIKGPLYSDALGEPDSDAGTYIGMIKANVNTIVQGLK